MPTWYGALVGGPSKSRFSTGRKIFNIFSAIWLLLVPNLVFGALFGLMSFSVRGNCPWLIWLIAFALFLVCLYIAYCTWDAYVKWKSGEGSYQTFLILLVVLLSVGAALLLAVVFGEMNFQNNYSKYAGLKQMNTYNDVSVGSGPGQMSGAQLMDAGRITFAPGTHVDVSMGSGLRETRAYCVAPIVGPDNNTVGSYDLWAVGVDCCVPQPGASWWCPEALNPNARAGLRLMDDSIRGYFRMAVQQVEAHYTIRATHPLFFTWVVDPYEEADTKKSNADQFFLIGLGIFFLWQLFLVLCVAFYFVKHENDSDAPQPAPQRAPPPPQPRRGHWQYVYDN